MAATTAPLPTAYRLEGDRRQQRRAEEVRGSHGRRGRLALRHDRREELVVGLRLKVRQLEFHGCPPICGAARRPPALRVAERPSSHTGGAPTTLLARLSPPHGPRHWTGAVRLAGGSGSRVAVARPWSPAGDGGAARVEMAVASSRCPQVLARRMSPVRHTRQLLLPAVCFRRARLCACPPASAAAARACPRAHQRARTRVARRLVTSGRPTMPAACRERQAWQAGHPWGAQRAHEHVRYAMVTRPALQAPAPCPRLHAWVVPSVGMHAATTSPPGIRGAALDMQAGGAWMGIHERRGRIGRRRPHRRCTAWCGWLRAAACMEGVVSAVVRRAAGSTQDDAGHRAGRWAGRCMPCLGCPTTHACMHARTHARML